MRVALDGDDGGGDGDDDGGAGTAIVVCSHFDLGCIHEATLIAFGKNLDRVGG